MIECISTIRPAEENGKLLYQPIGRRTTIKEVLIPYHRLSGFVECTRNSWRNGDALNDLENPGKCSPKDSQNVQTGGPGFILFSEMSL